MMNTTAFVVLIVQVVTGVITVSMSHSLKAGVVFSAAAGVFVVGLYVFLFEIKKIQATGAAFSLK